VAWTVSAAFDEFHEKINLSGDHRATANSRRDHIVSLIKNAFDVIEAFASGSIPRFTAVREYADVDVIVALHYSKHVKDKTPSQVLQAMRDCLGAYRTDVRRNGQAVTLYYQTWPNVDIVPCSQSVDNAGNVTHYNIPDSVRGHWILSKPKDHSRDIENRSSACGPSFRKLIKMMKWWNHKHSDYLQSYHLEVMALRSCSGLLNDMPWDAMKLFDNSSTLVQSSLWHEGGYVDSYLSQADREAAHARLRSAYSVALSAWHATYGSKNDHRTAIERWRQVFGSDFPAYG
jgi:hypothetical protein